jgi:uncharacterized OB-fold protein
MSEYRKPIPVPGFDSQLFWQGCKRHELMIPHCQDCGAYHFFPRFFCTKCMSKRIEWVKSKGVGTIYTFTIIDRAGIPSFQKEVPYVLALVELAEGVRMMTNIVECGPEKIKIGMKVEVVFEDITDEIALPKFRPRLSQ